MNAHDNELNARKLHELGKEISRIAGTLRHGLSDERQSFSRGPADGHGAPDVSTEAVAAVIRDRRLRARYFDKDLFADPAWDIMLDLLHGELSHRRTSVSSLCIAAAVPNTTALRWIRVLADKGILVRHDDPLDRRRSFVELSPDASQALRRYFDEKNPNT